MTVSSARRRGRHQLGFRCAGKARLQSRGRAVRKTILLVCSQLGLPGEAVILGNLGLAALLAGKPDEATAFYRDALLAAHGFGQADYVCYALEGLAESWIARGHAWTDAVRLFGRGRGSPRGTAAPALTARSSELYENSILAAQQKLGETRYSNALTEGKQLTLDDAIALALSLT